MAYFAAVIGQSACFGRRDAADNSLVSRRSRGRIANLRSISPSEKNQIRGNPHNRICKKIALQQPKTGKFDYLSEPNHPAHSMAFKFFTDDEFATVMRDYSEEIAAKNRAYVETARNTTDMISSHIEAVRAAMKAVAHEGAPTAAHHVAIIDMRQALQ